MTFPRAVDGQRPPATQDRLGHERGKQVARPLPKRCEAVGVDDRPLLPRHLAVEDVEGYILDVCRPGSAERHRHARTTTAVGVDDEVQRRPADLPGVGVERRVLEPHAGMEEVGLMAAHDDRPGNPIGDVGRPGDVAVVARVFGRHHQHLAPGRGHKLPEPHVADPRIEGGSKEPVVVDKGLDRAAAEARGHGRIDKAAAGRLGRRVGSTRRRHCRQRGPGTDDVLAGGRKPQVEASRPAAAAATVASARSRTQR